MRTVPTPQQVATLLALADYVESDDRDLDGEPVTVVKRLEPNMDCWWVFCRCWRDHRRIRILDANGWVMHGDGDTRWRCPFGVIGDPRSLYYSCAQAAQAFVQHLLARPPLNREWIAGA